MPSLTTNFSLNKPLVNNATDQDLWGGYLNDNMDTIDTQLLLCRDWKKRSITGTNSMVAGDRHKILLCDATLGAFTETLISAATAGDGFEFTAVKTDSTANSVTLDGAASDTIAGASTFALSGQGDAATLVSDGVSNWNFKGNKTTPSAVASASTTAQGIIEIATTAEAEAGTDSARAITAEGAKALLNTLITSVSTQKVVLGALTIQWGTSTSSTTVTFPTAFSAAPYSIQQTWTSSSAANTGITSSSNTGFVKAGSVASMWVAIGPT